MLKYKGHQVAPSEVEAVVGLHPSVADAGVIGVPDGSGNALPRAYVTLKSHANASAIAEDLERFLNARVSAYKRLRGGVVVVDEIPRNHNGKIQRDVLKQWATQSQSKL